MTTIPKLREHDLELMPVEFSVAAYRFGHSMVRSRYRLNADIEDPSSLALCNLERGAIFQLPSGQSVARAMGMP